MKKKTIWKSVITLSALFLSGVVMSFNMNKKDGNKTLRIAFPAKNAIQKYEPTNIQFASEYLLLENIFSSLVELDPKTGLVMPGVAEKYSWNGDSLEFHIRTNLKTKSGKLITADDVAFSLKRLLVLSGNTHGNFKDLVCPEFEMKSIDQKCPGIDSKDGKVILNAGKRKTFLLPMLTTVDFAIIPKSSVDPSTLAIKDYSETSGVYWVSNDDKNGNIELTVNPTHYHYSQDIPQKVVFVPTDLATTNSALTLFQEGKADHLMTYSGSRAEEVIAASEKMSDANLHLTMKIQTIVLLFTERGQKELSTEYRRYISRQMKEAFHEIYENRKGYQTTDEFFPAFSDGGLSRQQKQELKDIYANKSINDNKKFKIGFLKAGGLDPWIGPVAKRLSQADIYLEKIIPAMNKYSSPSDEPHAVIVSTDSGFKEDISLISYSLNSGIFGLDKNERATWIAKYMEQTDSTSRLESLRSLHFEALMNAKLTPLVVSPYAALIRKPWKMELSELYANNQLWLVKND